MTPTPDFSNTNDPEGFERQFKSLEELKLICEKRMKELELKPTPDEVRLHEVSADAIKDRVAVKHGFTDWNHLYRCLHLPALSFKLYEYEEEAMQEYALAYHKAELDKKDKHIIDLIYKVAILCEQNKQKEKEIEELKTSIKSILPLAESEIDRIIKSGSSHQEFISEDKAEIRKAKDLITTNTKTK